jgi:hypothetical protein
MANPNIVNVTTITGKTTGQAITTAATAIVSNATSSGKLLKINSLYISNVNGTASADVTVDVYKGGTTAYRLAYLITVPAKSTINVIAKDVQVYLEENDSLRLTASINSYLEGVCSYEEIS